MPKNIANTGCFGELLLNGVQEASSSNLDTRTKKAERAFVLSAFLFFVEIRKIKCNAGERCWRGWTEPFLNFAYLGKMQ